MTNVEMKKKKGACRGIAPPRIMCNAKLEQQHSTENKTYRIVVPVLPDNVTRRVVDPLQVRRDVR